MSRLHFTSTEIFIYDLLSNQPQSTTLLQLASTKKCINAKQFCEGALIKFTQQIKVVFLLMIDELGDEAGPIFLLEQVQGLHLLSCS